MFASDALSGTPILVTGGGSGLGLAMTRRCLGLGARVAILGRSAERLEEAVRTLGAGDRLVTRSCDVRNDQAVQDTIGGLWTDFGPLDVVVNNAAGNLLAPIEDLSPNGFDAVVKIVLYGSFNVSVWAGRQRIDAQPPGTLLHNLT